MVDLPSPSTPHPGLLSLSHIRNTFSSKAMKCNASPDPHRATQTCCCPRKLQGTLPYLWFSVLISLHALQRGDEAAHRVFPPLHICTGENTAGCIHAPSLSLHLYMVDPIPAPSHWHSLASGRESGVWPILTLDVPCSPDHIVESNFIPAKQSQPLEILPLWRY